MQFQVITQVPEAGDPGNLAMANTVYQDNNDYEALRKPVIAPAQQLLMGWQQEVFHVGEVLIVNESGREIPYPGRKADKWKVDYEIFDNVDDACKRSEEVFVNSLKRI